MRCWRCWGKNIFWKKLRCRSRSPTMNIFHYAEAPTRAPPRATRLSYARVRVGCLFERACVWEGNVYGMDVWRFLSIRLTTSYISQEPCHSHFRPKSKGVCEKTAKSDTSDVSIVASHNDLTKLPNKGERL